MEYTPIVTRKISTDPDTGFDIIINVWQQHNDSKSEVILMVFDIDLITPTGVFVKTIKTGKYSRTGIKYSQLRGSSLGQGIIGLIQNDINSIQSYGTIDQDLLQSS